MKLRASSVDITPASSASANAGAQVQLYRWLYFASIAVRLWMNQFAWAYIHPDEYMQPLQVLDDDFYHKWSSQSLPSTSTQPHLQRPWEFEPKHACRSAFPLYLVYGIPLTAVRLAVPGLGPELLLRLLRLITFALSLLIDACLWKLLVNLRQPNSSAWRTMLLHGCSYTTSTFLQRPFSNTLETVVLSVCLYLVDSMSSHSRRNTKDTPIWLGALCAFGCFVRMTFPAFAGPLVLYAANQHRHQLGGFVRQFLAGAYLVTGLGIVLDSIYFERLDVRQWMESTNTVEFLFTLGTQNFTLTPWNNLRYNFDPQNLAQHGIHPRYTHILVNLPMLFAPSLALLLWRGTRSQKFRLFLSPVLSSLLLLSIAPHQEPRFLLPSTICISVLLGTIRMPSSKLFWTVFVLFHGMLGLVFGFWHQGGIVPCLLELAHIVSPLSISNTTVLPIYIWKTYTPPLALMSGGGATMNVTDFGGWQQSHIRTELEHAPAGSLLILPQYMMMAADSKLHNQQWSLLSHCPQTPSIRTIHLSFDDMAEFLAAFRDKPTLSLGIFEKRKKLT